MSTQIVAPAVSVVTATSPSDLANYTKAEYNAFAPRWAKVRAACSGQEAVKKIIDVLPTLNPQDKSKDNEIRNAQYLERAVYFNATGRTKDGLIGLAFAKNPDIRVGKFDYLKDNANGKGGSLYNLAQEALGGVLQTGRHGLLTDLINEKPGIASYPAESIINWRYTTDVGKQKLSLLVLWELLSTEDGEFGEQYVQQWRVYKRDSTGKVSCKLYRADNGKDPQFHSNVEIRKPNARDPLFDEIPFSFVGSVANSADMQPIPLEALATMNLAHFRNSADFEDSVFLCGQPQAYITNLEETWRDWLENKGIYVGSRKVLLLPQNSVFDFAQVQANTLVKEAMEQKRTEMIALGARVVEENKITKTATQAAGDIATGTSVLGLCCVNANEAVTRALQFCGMFDNGKSFTDALFAMTQDFTVVTADAQTISSMVEAWQAGAIGTTDKNTWFKKAGLIDAERKDDEIQQDVETTQDFLTSLEPDPAPVAGAKPPTSSKPKPKPKPTSK